MSIAKLSGHKAKTLLEELRMRGLSKSGTKDVLIRRLLRWQGTPEGSAVQLVGL